MSINQKNRPHSQLCGTFSFRCILVLGAIFIGSIQQPAVSFAQVEDPGDAVHNGSLLTADFGTNHDQTVPEVWEYAGDYVQAHADANPPTTPGPIDRAFGAFTVRNENDTDGDGLVDNYVHELDDSLSENDVIATGTNNRDEVDLIRFTIMPPMLGAVGRNSKISLTSSGENGSSCVVFWKHKTKTEKYGDGTKVEIANPTPGTVIEVWCEMQTQSPAIAGWYVHCSYIETTGAGKTFKTVRKLYDRIAVTSIWAESAGTRAGRHYTQIVERPGAFEVVVPMVAGISMNSGDWVVIYDDKQGAIPTVFDSATQCVMFRVLDSSSDPQWPELQNIEFLEPLPAWVDSGDYFTEGLSPEVDSSMLIETFKQINLLCHIGANRLRNRPLYGIETRYAVYPNGMAVTRMSNGEFAKFDIARQTRRQRRVGSSNPPPHEDWPKGDEKPNDQGADTDDQDVETTAAWQGLVRIDAPGQPESAVGVPITLRVEMRMNAREFVRVGLDGVRPEGDFVRGSRCSGKEKWHATLDVTPGVDGFWHRTAGSANKWNAIVAGIHLLDADFNEIGPGN